MNLSVTRPIHGEATASPRAVAVIDIGATSIRMAIAEIKAEGEVRTLDNLVQSVDLGRDAFDNRRLSRKNIERAVQVLKRYQRVLNEYGITSPRDIRVVATSAVREASNRLAFADRVFIATGLNIDLMDEAEVNRITYMGVMPDLMSRPELMEGKSLVVEIGGGSTEMLVIRGGNVLQSQSFRLGSLRLLMMLEDVNETVETRHSMLKNHIDRTLEQIFEAADSDAETHLVALGGDIRFATRQILDWDGQSLARLSVKKLAKLTDKILSLSVDEIVKKYDVSYIEAETLGPALMSYRMLAKHFSLSELYVSDTNLRDGLFHDMASGTVWTNEFRNQIIRSALTLGRKYGFEETHARNVAELSRMLFLQLHEYHQLDSRHEVILFAAALLHEIGMVINVRSNHKHSLYLIRNSELFGLSQEELLKVGLVARYHRRAFPQPSHDGYASLSQQDRVSVAMMAAILRLAIALDDTRTGRIREIQCFMERKQLVIQIPNVNDVSLEQLAMRENAALFREVFGMQVILRGGR